MIDTSFNISPVSPGAGQPVGAPRQAALPGGGEVAPREFADVLGEAVVGLREQLQRAEGTSIAALQGRASIQDVVEQVSSAEQALQASIAVRDKIIAAYLEISRMSI